jgi:hypothetical protein
MVQPKVANLRFRRCRSRVRRPPGPAGSPARMIGALVQPTLFLLSLGFGLGPTFARAGRGDYVQFRAPGIVTMGILFTAVFSGIGIIWDRHFGFLRKRWWHRCRGSRLCSVGRSAAPRSR